MKKLLPQISHEINLRQERDSDGYRYDMLMNQEVQELLYHCGMLL